MEHTSSFRTSVRLLKPKSGGFTLLEMLIVVVIISVVTAIILASQSAFNKTLILANAAYDVALSIRSAETFGIGNRAAASGSTKAGYGLRFAIGTPTSYLMFVDTYPGVAAGSLPNVYAGNKIYDGGTGQDELIQSYVLGNGIRISDLCVYSAVNGARSCVASGIQYVDVVFRRPNTDTTITAYPNVGVNQKVCLTLTSGAGGARYVTVTSAGLITASNTACPS